MKVEPGSARVLLQPLSRQVAERWADTLLTMNADSGWDDWDRDNLLSERPGKWDLSLLATVDDSPVAWAVASRQAESLHLHHIVVAPQRRSAGIGELLVRALMSRAAPGRMTLKVHPDNHAAARFYRRLGFEEGETTPRGYRTFAIQVAEPRPVGEDLR